MSLIHREVYGYKPPRLSKLQLLWIVLVARHGVEEALGIMNHVVEELVKGNKKPFIQLLEKYSEDVKMLQREIRYAYS